MTLPSRPLVIAVIGGSNADEEALSLAYQVGAELAKRGALLVCGGLGGVMEAACKGAKAHGGTTVRILPGSDPVEANPYVDIPICTGIGHVRNIIVVRSGRAVIAIDGAYGTLSEIAHALGDGIPVVGLKTWEFSTHGRQPVGALIPASGLVDAVEKAIAAAQERAVKPSPLAKPL
ncbi:MAG: TIGR00725 family protein [Dehalococcoidia bacterium]|nr:TIGR00725 family protein [Dehalococcoidia bacterium]